MSEVTREQAFNALIALIEYIAPCEVKAIGNVEIARTYIAQLEQRVKDLQHEVKQKTSALWSIENGTAPGISPTDMVGLLRGEARAVLTAFADNKWQKIALAQGGEGV